MRNRLLLSDPISTPNFLARRRQPPATIASSNSKAHHPKPKTSVPVYSSPCSSSPKESAPDSFSLVTTTSCSDRLHLVLARRTKAELSELYEELSNHKEAKHVCVYADSPLVTRGPFSRSQTSDLLTKTALQCKEMTSLQLDFSNEFGPQRDVYLKVSLLSKVLEQAPQLTFLQLKDVPLKGTEEDVEELRRVLSQHSCLETVQLKWCLEANAEQPVMPSLLECLAVDMPCLSELTLLVSCGAAAQLPLPLLAKSKHLQKLTIAIEQRHSTWQRKEVLQKEVKLVFELLEKLQFNQTVTDLTIYSQHWKADQTLQAVIQLIEAKTTALKKFEIFDYTYGNEREGTNQLLELALALQCNQQLEHFKLHSKRSAPQDINTSPSLDKSYQAMLQCVQHNIVLETLDISHCGLSLVNATPSFITNNATTSNKKYQTICKDIEFFLHSNKNGARRRFLHQDFSAEHWVDFVAQEKHDTPLLYHLLQANPSLFLARHKVFFES